MLNWKRFASSWTSPERIGASYIRIFGGSVPAGATEDQSVSWAVETLKRSAEEAGKKGITLGIEDDTGITMKADRMVEIVTKAGSEWAGINLDIGNFPGRAVASERSPTKATGQPVGRLLGGRHRERVRHTGRPSY